MGDIDVKFEKAGKVKSGQWVLVDGAVCRVTDVQISSPGKHGSAKVRITAVGVFDGQKRQMLKPSGADVEVPIIKRKFGQVLTVMDDQVQIMDLESYETFELPMPEDEELKGKLEPGMEIEYMEAGDHRKISKVKG